MPNYSNQLPAKTQHRGYDLRRTPADKPIKGLITSEDLIGCFTHWWGGRTVPCEGDGCEACKNNAPSRWHCYLTLHEDKTHDHFIFECTGKAALPLIEWRDTHHTLRGTLLIASRPKRRRNARVEIILKPYDLTGVMLPTPPDLKKAMAVIWQIPGAAVETDGAINQTNRMVTDNAVLDAQRLNAADGNGKPRPRKKVKT